MEKLEARIRNHDREIEKMCNFHYQGFVDSITELLKVRGEAQKLKVRESHPDVVLVEQRACFQAKKLQPQCADCCFSYIYLFT